MTKAIDAAIRIECQKHLDRFGTDGDACCWPACKCFTGQQALTAIHATLPAEPPEWFERWFLFWGDPPKEQDGWVNESWLAFRAHLLGEDA